MVLSIKFLKADHLLAVGAAGGALPMSVSSCDFPCGPCEAPMDMSARFFSNRSRSMRSSFSFLFNAPGLLFRLLCLIFACPTSTAPSSPSASAPSSSPASGSASARDSSVVTSCLFGRRFFFEVADFCTFDMRRECLISRLSFLVGRKEENGVSTTGPVAAALSDAGALEAEVDLDALARSEARLPLVGACEHSESKCKPKYLHTTYHAAARVGVGGAVEGGGSFLKSGGTTVCGASDQRHEGRVPASILQLNFSPSLRCIILPRRQRCF